MNENNDDNNENTSTINSQFGLKSMIAIDAPAVVKNINNFFKCCGGIKQIEQIFRSENERLQFRFRPEDQTSIPLFSERKTTVDLAVKVKRKRQPDGTFGEYQFEPIGIVDTTFHFDNTISDVQVLPASTDIQNELMKSDFILNCDSNYSLEHDESNTFIRQYFYSRFTQPKNTFPMLQKEDQKDLTMDIIKKLRRSRKSLAISIRWDNEIPKELPLSTAAKIEENFYFCKDLLEKIKEKFQERVIWSRHALLCHLKCSSLQLRYVLPMFAYYYENGPFRNLFLPFGYDPKKDPKSKIYQIIDTRVLTLMNINQNENSNRLKMNKCNMFTNNKNRSMVSYLDSPATSSKNLDVSNLVEDSYIFRPGNISSLKRISFQLCDIEIEEVQKIIHENDGQETECTEKDGWLAKGSIERIRAILNQEVKNMLKKIELTKSDSEIIEVSTIYDDNWIEFDDIDNMDNIDIDNIINVNDMDIDDNETSMLNDD